MCSRKQRKAKKSDWKPILVKLLLLLLLPACYGLTKIASANPELVEKYYADGIYPYISSFVGKLSSFAGNVSVAELIIYAVIIAIISIIIIFVVGIFNGKTHFRGLVNLVVSLALVFTILFNLFYWMWGFNYFRPSLASRMDLDISERSSEELKDVSLMLSEKASILRKSVDENSNGVFELKFGYAPYFDSVTDAFEVLGQSYEEFSGKVYPAKRVLASKAMSYAGITGIFIPFTGEANVNTDEPALMMLSSAAHETAHFFGVAAEDEANFISYLACINSNVPAIEYSGIMLALINCTNELYGVDKEMYYDVTDTYSDAMLRDLAAYSEYWKAFKGPIEEKATEINDNYLKFNEQDSGVDSYGMMVDLILAYYAKY